jgi:hypothetical protein
LPFLQTVFPNGHVDQRLVSHPQPKTAMVFTRLLFTVRLTGRRQQRLTRVNRRYSVRFYPTRRPFYVVLGKHREPTIGALKGFALAFCPFICVGLITSLLISAMTASYWDYVTSEGLQTTIDAPAVCFEHVWIIPELPVGVYACVYRNHGAWKSSTLRKLHRCAAVASLDPKANDTVTISSPFIALVPAIQLNWRPADMDRTVLATVTATVISSMSPSAVQPPVQSPVQPPPQVSQGLSTPDLAGLVIGAILATLVSTGLGWFLLKRYRRKKKDLATEQDTTKASQPPDQDNDKMPTTARNNTDKCQSDRGPTFELPASPAPVELYAPMPAEVDGTISPVIRPESATFEGGGLGQIATTNHQ